MLVVRWLVTRRLLPRPGAAAYGGYVDSSLTDSNFGKLRIVTSADASDEDQMAAAGFLEGWLTAGAQQTASGPPRPPPSPSQPPPTKNTTSTLHTHNTAALCIPAAAPCGVMALLCLFIAGRINDHYHNVHHYFTHQLNASLERPMQWWVSVGAC